MHNLVSQLAYYFHIHSKCQYQCFNHSPPEGAPIPPPRRARLDNFNKDNLYEKFPSLNQECMVRSRVLEDEEVIKERKELVQSKTPSELSEIHGLGEIPVPGFVEHSMDSLKRMRTRSRER